MPGLKTPKRDRAQKNEFWCGWFLMPIQWAQRRLGGHFEVSFEEFYGVPFGVTDARWTSMRNCYRNEVLTMPLNSIGDYRKLPKR